MGLITVEIWDSTGNKRQTAEIPDDAPVDRIMAVLVDRMSLPKSSPDGAPMSYKFHHKASGRQLQDEETLAAGGVKDGDVLRIVPEITAGQG
ncbi:MAG: EsaB/YukD family protein [Candidatus Sumerlaeota bacterium]|nr:EsaB/YukD family protein [Candidatus Sumerlaeota bacterium]